MTKASILDRAKAQLVLHEPFYGTILLNLNPVYCDKTPDGEDLFLAATNGTELFVNPTEFEKLTINEAKGVLKHEVMHVALLHPFRAQGLEPERWNHAADMAINPVILDEGGELPAGVLDGSSFKGQTAEQIYRQLPPNPQKNDGGGGSGPKNPMGRDVLTAKDRSSLAQEQAKQMVASAAAVAKAQGKLPERIRQQLDDIMNPKVDWSEALRSWLSETTQTDYSFRRPNRRFLTGDEPLYLPSMDGIEAMGELGFVIDTSGSMGIDEIKQALGEVAGAVADVSPRKLVVAYCDAAVQHHDVFEQPTEAHVREKIERHGGGGTNMPAALTWFRRKFPNVRGVVVYTDGMTPFGDEENYPFPVLWAITTKREAPWGVTLHVPANG